MNAKVSTHTIEVALYEEIVVPGKRLGRHVVHDSRSLAFNAVDMLPGKPKPPTEPVTHSLRMAQVLDQGDLGDCTTNAMTHALMCDPLWVTGRAFTEQTAINLYELATTLDDIPGNYPPDDTGSTGLAAAKAAKRDGYLTGYAHAFGLTGALVALGQRPVIIGIDWYSSFDTPDPATGLIDVTTDAYIRGGHEVCLNAVNPEARLVYGLNSWGPSWGVNGCFAMSFDTLEGLLADGGDVTVGLANTAPSATT